MRRPESQGKADPRGCRKGSETWKPWHLDVTFREDANTTIDKMAAQNLNIIRKWSLSILKPAELSRHKLSMRKKRFVVSLRPIKYLEELLEA